MVRVTGALANPALISEVMATLEPSLHEVLVLLVTEGLSYRQIAHRLEIPLSTVSTRIHRARRALQRLLAERMRGSDEP